MVDETQAASPETPTLSQFYYSIDEYEILLEPTAKTEIVEQRTIYPIPHAPEWCQGMVSLRGKLIPIVNIHHLLGRSLKDKSHWLLIIETGDLPAAAVRIDKLPSQHQIQVDAFQTMTGDTMPFWIKRFAEIEEKPVYEADHTVLFQSLIMQNMQSPSVSIPEPNHLAASEVEA